LTRPACTLGSATTGATAESPIPAINDSGLIALLEELPEIRRPVAALVKSNSGTVDSLKILTLLYGAILLQRKEDRSTLVVEEISPHRSDPAVGFYETPVPEFDIELHAWARPTPQAVCLLRLEHGVPILLILKGRGTKQAPYLFDRRTSPQRSEFVARDSRWRPLTPARLERYNHQQ
jgi:hypothetical protein